MATDDPLRSTINPGDGEKRPTGAMSPDRPSVVAGAGSAGSVGPPASVGGNPPSGPLGSVPPDQSNTRPTAHPTFIARLRAFSPYRPRVGLVAWMRSRPPGASAPWHPGRGALARRGPGGALWQDLP